MTLALTSLAIVILLTIAGVLWHLDKLRAERDAHLQALADVEHRRLQRARAKAAAR